MTSVIDLWRAVDPEARLVSGSVDRLRAAVRGVARSKAAPPHLPEVAEGHLLVLDAALVPAASGLDAFLRTLREAGVRPVAVTLAGVAASAPALDRAGEPLPVLATTLTTAAFADGARLQLEHGETQLAAFARELRLAAAEAALADPDPSAAAGLVAGRLRRGVAVTADGELRALHPRPAGRALAARFAALHARLLATAQARTTSRQSSEGLFLLERRVRAGASVWLFDDLPFARIDEVAADALTITLRALLRRPSARRAPLRPLSGPDEPGVTDAGPTASVATLSTLSAPVRETLLAVARCNGRVATAARELGVHRNTVLYRLRRASAELAVDPRKAADAIAILRAAEESTGR